ncbi:MAG: tRNA (guanosine(37)-N1)-methyltransferase TrmD [Ornithinimicrobium sp.]
MRIDVFSIFPSYLDPLDQSLIGRARKDGLLDVRVHDLRNWAHDRHRTVDDTPYGGGAGMVMRPEPWGEALDWLAGSGAGEEPQAPHLIVPGPAGAVFTQELAEDLAREPWLVFACGRYEGIDERVIEYARTVMPVSVVSLGDYVVNGGEVATLAMVEAIARLVPGVIGNADSLTEESHTGGLLEYPVYTKPQQWRGREVPSVLLSGDHQGVLAWRERQRRQRTVERRPDLLAPSALLLLEGSELGGRDLDVASAVPADAGEILTLARACWLSEARDHDSFAIPALNESLEDVTAWLREWHTWVVRSHGRLVGSVRARQVGALWDIGRLMVAPDLQGRGLGKALLAWAEQAAPEDVTGFSMFTGANSVANLRMYRRAGYRTRGRSTYEGVPTVELYKSRP